MTLPWAPDVIERLRARYRDRAGDDGARWMARRATDREFCRWLLFIVDAPLTDDERVICLAVTEARPPEHDPDDKMLPLDALQRAVAIGALDRGAPHLRPRDPGEVAETKRTPTEQRGPFGFAECGHGARTPTLEPRTQRWLCSLCLEDVRQRRCDSGLTDDRTTIPVADLLTLVAREAEA